LYMASRIAGTFMVELSRPVHSYKKDRSLKGRAQFARPFCCAFRRAKSLFFAQRAKFWQEKRFSLD
ncbi:MAG: hypothetical protein KAS96_10220, partial [Planctomycetes bacterium]|nr:hypothetical protein [Planctomycetota bacterium]